MASADCARCDDDRFNIKFVSHFVDIPDDQEYDETQNENREVKKTKNEKDSKSYKSSSNSGKSSSSSPSKKSSQRDGNAGKDPGKSSNSSNSKKPLQRDRNAGKEYKNKHRSSPRRHSSTSANEQSELQSSYGDTHKVYGITNSNRQISKTWWRSSSSNDDFDEDESSLFSPSISSSNDDEDKNHVVLAHSDKHEQLCEKEIVLSYGQIRQIIRGPAANDPTDVQLVSTVEVAGAEGGKETLYPLTTVTESPRIVDPAKTSTSHDREDNGRRNTATIATQRGVEKEGIDGGYPTRSVRSEAATQAGRHACARIAKMQLYQTQSDDLGGQRSSTKTPTNDLVASPFSRSAPQMPDLRDNAGNDGESSPMDFATPFYGRGRSPWLMYGYSNVRAAADDVIKSASFLAAQHQSQVPHNSRDPAIPRPDTAKILRDELDYLLSPVVIDDLSLEQVVHPTERERNVVVANVAQPSISLPPSLAPPLASCLKYRSTSTHDASRQLRRKIRFAEDVQQHREQSCNQFNR